MRMIEIAEGAIFEPCGHFLLLQKKRKSGPQAVVIGSVGFRYSRMWIFNGPEHAQGAHSSPGARNGYVELDANFVSIAGVSAAKATPKR